MSDKAKQVVESLQRFNDRERESQLELAHEINNLLGLDLNEALLVGLREELGVSVEMLPSNVKASDFVLNQIKESVEDVKISGLVRLVTPRVMADIDEIQVDIQKTLDDIRGCVDEAVTEARKWRELHCVCGTNPPMIERVTVVDPFQVHCKVEGFQVEYFLYAGLYMHLRKR